jgi:glycosyltransferase involved in cell wall biosynthesis
MTASTGMANRAQSVPLVTVVLPTHNGMPYLPQAVASILDQTLRDLSLLIIDDGSNDGTADYLESLTDPRVHVVLGSHRGLGTVLNQGLELCRSEFLARMDADDLSWPRRLEQQLAFLRSRPEVGMLGTQFEYMAGNRKPVLSPSLPCDHATITAELLQGNLAIVHASAVFRTAILRRIGYRIHGMGEDWDMFVRLGEITQIANHDQVLYSYRLHRGNSDLHRFVTTRIGIQYACHCAKLRQHGELEPTLETFREGLQSASRLSRMMALLDANALSQYRLALVDLAEERKVRGYARLGWSAACSPMRALLRVRRIISNFWRRAVA